jgi:hypothetical protein
VVTPEGKVLAFHYHKPKPGESAADAQKRWLDETRQMVRDAVKDAGPLAAREVKEKPNPLAGRGVGTDPDGGARLAASVVSSLNGRRDGPPVVDSIRFSAEEWAAFAPPKDKMTEGQEWTVPEAVARKFAPALGPMTDPIFTPKPGDVTTAKVTAKVERVADGVVVVRFSGEWASAHDRDGNPKYPIRTAATGEAVGIFDAKTGKATALVWLLKGSFRNSPPADRPRATAAVIEWTAAQEKP